MKRSVRKAPHFVFRAAVSALLALAALLTTVDGNAVPLPSLTCTPPATDPEIADLARSLHYDLSTIYEYVYYSIDYSPTWGLKKNALATLLDKRGNQIDQNTLFVELLRQSCISANYRFGAVQASTASLASLLGVNNTVPAVTAVLGNGGLSANVGADNTVINMVWTEAVSNGATYELDPSYKSYADSPPVDLASAMGYSRSGLMAAVSSGSSTVPGIPAGVNSIAGLNRAALTQTLNQYSQNLADYIRATKPASSTSEIFGGRQITNANYGTTFPSGGTLYTALPATFETVFTLSVSDQANGSSPSLSVTLYASQIEARRLTLTYDTSRRPILSLQGTVIATGAPTTLARQTVSFGVSNPYPAGYAFVTNSAQTSVPTGGSYAVVLDAGEVGRDRMTRHQVAAAWNAKAGMNDEAVTGESLAALGASYVAQSDRADRFYQDALGIVFARHESMGIAGKAQAGYVDFPSRIAAATARSGQLSGQALVSTVLSTTIFGSSLESTAVTQMLNNPAVSTVRLFDYTNSDGIGIVEANSANWSQVQSVISGWSAGDLSRISSFLASNPTSGRVFLPMNGRRNVGAWSGSGFFEVSTNNTPSNYAFASAIITEGYSGGYGTLLGFDSSAIWWNQFNPTFQFSLSSPVSNEPVDLHSGAYTYDHNDIDTGTGDFPFSLRFARSYDSTRTNEIGPLGAGWRHNFMMSAAVDSDSFEAFGDHAPLAAVPAVVANFIVADIVNNQGSTLQSTVASSLIASWLMDQLVDNAVTLKVDGGTKKFMRIPTSTGVTYVPPPGDTSSLVVNTDHSMVLTDKHLATYSFDTDGDITRWKDSNNNTVSFSYAGSGSAKHLTQVGNGMGRTLSLSYAGDALSGVSDGTRSVGYSRTGNALTSFTDATGHSTRFSYDSDDHLVSVFYPTFPSVAFMTNTYGMGGKVRTQADADGHVWVYLSADGLRSEEINPAGGSNTLYFDRAGNHILDIDQLGNRTTFTYDGIGRPVSSTYPAGDGETLSYDARGNVSGKVRTPIPGAYDPLTGTTMAPITESATFDPVFNKPLSETDGWGDVTTHTYDAVGNLLSTTQPQVYSTTLGGVASPVTHYAYNARGQVTQVTDPEGRVTTNTYDPATAVLLSQVGDAGSGHLNLTMSYGYDATGNRTSVTDPDGRSSTFAFDALRHLVTEIPPSPFTANVTTHGYDLDGRETSVSHATGNVTSPWSTTTTIYNAAGKVNLVTQPDGTSKASTYDVLGRLASETSSSGRAVVYGYDAASHLTSTTEQLSGTPDSSITMDVGPVVKERLAYYNTGDVATVQDANGDVLTYHYDGFKRREQVVYPDGTYDLHAFNAIGKEGASQQRSGLVIGYAYDALGRMVEKWPDDGLDTGYGYDLSGRRTLALDSSGLTLTYAYDTAGRAVGESRADIGSTTWTLDGGGHHLSTMAPGVPAYVTRASFDAMGRLTDVYEGAAPGGQHLVHYDYDALSRRTAAVYGSSALARTDYEWTSTGQASSIAHTWQGGGVTFDYGYNADHQRSSLDVDDPSFIASSTPTTATSYATNGQNQYLSVAGTGLTYDTDGNLTGDGTWTYGYDTQKHLISASKAGTTVAYTYDPVGRRAAKTINGVTTRYLSVGDEETAEVDGTNAVTRRYVYGPGLDEPLVMVNASGARSYHLTDALGSTVALLSDAGAPTETHAYDSYGATSSSASTPYLFAGRRFDSETGLYYNRARTYSPVLGRFLQNDPSGVEGGGPNLYAYASNDPLNLTDPTGLRPGDIYAVTPATIGFWAILTTNINVFGQRLAGSTGQGYSHAAIEIEPNAYGYRQVAESEPSGARIRDMALLMAESAGRGSEVQRFALDVPITADQADRLTAAAEMHVGDPYNFMIFFTDRSNNHFTCLDWCDFAARLANMPPVNNKSDYGLSPLPSDLSNSPNYHLAPSDWKGK